MADQKLSEAGTESAQDIADLSRAQANAGNFTDAYRTLRRIEIGAREAPDIVYLQASLAIFAQRWADALAHLDDLMQVRPAHVGLLLHRASCLLELGREDEAEAMLQAEDSPMQGHYARHVLLAQLAARRAQTAQAFSHLQEACRLHPDAVERARQIPQLAALLADLVAT
jgi:Flp pilus assembly protein TadD